MLKGSFEWFQDRAPALQAMMAVLTALLAAAALLGVKAQIDASERVQQEQSARDIYREFLNLSISRPELADPDYCALKDTPAEPAYEHYVEYMLYTAEQALAADEEWRNVFAGRLKMHATYICAVDDWDGYDSGVQTLIQAFKAKECAAVQRCKD